MNIWFKKIFVILSALVLTCANWGLVPKAESNGEDYKIFFGILKKDASGDYYLPLKSVTTKIPLKLKETGLRFGYEVTPKENKKHTISTVLYMPSPPKIKRKGSAGGGKENVFRTGEKTYSGKSAHAFYFNEGDPAGRWKMEIYIHGELDAVIKFNVIE